jgi:hypothetical protein
MFILEYRNTAGMEQPPSDLAPFVPTLAMSQESWQKTRGLTYPSASRFAQTGWRTYSAVNSSKSGLASSHHSFSAHDLIRYPRIGLLQTLTQGIFRTPPKSFSDESVI